MARLHIAILGAGAIGRRHAEIVTAEPGLSLSIVDPAPVGAALADRLGAACFPDLDALLATRRPDGLIVATPNRLHVPQGLTALAAGIPALIEKPLADDPAEGRRLVEAAEAARVPLLVGHHRRYGAVLRAAKIAVAEGRLGQILSAHAQCWLPKPDSYFEPDWRRAPGAGPILINLIHDIDALRFLVGEIASVGAIATHAGRNLAVEDGAAITLAFVGGAVGTVTVSDAIPAPWSWELTSGENPDYPREDAFAYLLGGSLGSLAIPSLDLWLQARRHWHTPLARTRLHAAPIDPLVEQIRHFAAVIRGDAAPRVSGREGLRTLEVVEAIHRSAETGATVALAEPELEGATP